MNQRDAKYIRLTTEPVQKLVCSFAVPAIISMMISSIYNIVDTYFVGHLDTQSTAALGVVFSYMSIIQALSFYFGHGSGNFISRALGARKGDEAEDMASVGFFSAIGLACVLAIVCAVFIGPVLDLFGATPTVLPVAKGYFRWILVGTPFITGTFVLNNQMRLQGNASLAVYGIMSGAVLNIILDPIFIFGLGMGVSGAGVATAISQFTSLMVMLKLCGRNGGISIKFSRFHPSFEYAKQINSGGLPSLARQSLMAVGTMLLNNCAGVYGDEALAAFSIVGRVMHLAIALLLGFGQGFQPVCGYNFGARRLDRLKKAFRFCVVVASAYSLCIAILGELLAPGIIHIFRADDPEVIRLGAMVLRAQCLTVPLTGFVMMSNMYLQTTNQTASAVTLAVARQGLFLIPALLIGSHFFRFTGIVAAQPISDLLSFGLAVPIVIRSLRRLPNLQ